MPWLTEKIWPFEAKLDGEDIYLGARLGIAEMLLGGTTTFVDMYWHSDRVADAVTETGIRGVVCPTFVGASYDAFEPEALRMAEEQHLDLVEVAPKAKPPVCRIMDFGKYRYEQQKREKEAKKKQKTINIKEVKNYFALSFIFTWTMSLSVLCNNIAFMWAAIEATTLASVFLVAVKNDKKSTESGYKYIVLCSIGLAFALYATILLYSAANGKIDGEAMLYTNLLANAANLDSMALKLVFIFALIGFGTKAGLAPTHTWLPDVHAEGPAPTSALLSGVLLKCAMLGLIRYYAVVANGVGFDFVKSNCRRESNCFSDSFILLCTIIVAKNRLCTTSKRTTGNRKNLPD
jgi:hypothetical protein